MQKQRYTKNMVYGMTYRGDCGGEGNSVPLHSENQRRAPLCERQALFSEREDAAHVVTRKSRR